MVRSAAHFLLVLAMTFLPAWAEPAPSPAPTPTPSESAATAAALPDEVRTLLEEAIALRRKGDESAALTRLDRLLAQAPGAALAAVERAEIQIAAGRAAQAESDVQLAVKSLPDNPRAQRLLGQWLEESQDVDGALAAYARSLAIRESPMVRRREALLLTRLGRHAEAVESWERICDVTGPDAAAWYALAMAYDRADRPASSEAAFEKALSFAPENPQIRRSFGDFLQRQGYPSRARLQLARAEKLSAPRAGVRRMRDLPASRR